MSYSALVAILAAVFWFTSAVASFFVSYGGFGGLTPRSQLALRISTISNACAAALSGVVALFFAAGR